MRLSIEDTGDGSRKFSGVFILAFMCAEVMLSVNPCVYLYLCVLMAMLPQKCTEDHYDVR
jgi:hypothetical protein